MSEEEDEQDLSSFLAKVDKIGDLVKDLATSNDHTSSSRAIEEAEKYMKQCSKTAQDRTVINTIPQDRKVAAKSPSIESPSTAAREDISQAAFCQSLEEDARERAERRKERGVKGKEAKRMGNKAFREGNFEEAVKFFTDAIKDTPWDITLYTNRAVSHNKLLHYTQAIEDCDTAIRFEPATLKAYIHKGNALRGLKQSKKARECYQKALEFFPKEEKVINKYLKELENEL